MIKKILSFLFAVVIVFSTCLSVLASPTESFIHSDEPGGDSSVVLSREMYNAAFSINAAKLGLEKSLNGLTDICSDAEGNVYILCGEESRLIKLAKDYSLIGEISVKDENGPVNFTGALGVYVNTDGTVYIADTKNSRVLVTDPDGKVKSVWGIPESNLLPPDFLYQPVSIAIDKKGYAYILSLGCYYGALAYSPEGQFIGFYGANTVKSNAVDTLTFLWDKLTKNDKKLSVSQKKLPYSFVDLALDSEGYMITCTGRTENSEFSTGQIRKISPGGYDILLKRGTDGKSVSSSSVNFMEKIGSKRIFQQNMAALAVDEAGFMYGLDKSFGIIYVYDSECNLMNAFGGGNGLGDELGIFHTPVSIAVHGDDVLVADADNKNITVFDITDYGKLLKNAHSLYIKGDYNEAKPLWEEVLKQNRSSQIAYRGLAMSDYSEGNYRSAIKNAKIGLDYVVYDMAWKELTSEFLANNLAWILPLIIVLLGGIIAAVVYIKKKNIVLVTNVKAKTLLNVTFHPFESFTAVRYKKQGSVLAGAVIAFLLYLGMSLEATSSGFLFNQNTPEKYNTLYTLAQTIGFLLLWVISNWLVCMMFSGKGKLDDVFIGTTYSLIPLVVFIYVRLVLSYVMPMSGVAFFESLQTIIWIYTFFLLSVAMMTVHEYDFFKFLTTGIAIIFLMIVIVFVLFLFMSLFKQVIDFVFSIYEEVIYR